LATLGNAPSVKSVGTHTGSTAQIKLRVMSSAVLPSSGRSAG